MRVIPSAILALSFGISSLTFTADEFDKERAVGLAMGQHIQTDCSINWTKPDDGKSYCFSSDATKSVFLKTPTVNLRKAYEELGRRRRS